MQIARRAFRQGISYLSHRHWLPRLNDPLRSFESKLPSTGQELAPAFTKAVNRLLWRLRAFPSATLDKMRTKLLWIQVTAPEWNRQQGRWLGCTSMTATGTRLPWPNLNGCLAFPRTGRATAATLQHLRVLGTGFVSQKPVTSTAGSTKAHFEIARTRHSTWKNGFVSQAEWVRFAKHRTSPLIQMSEHPGVKEPRTQRTENPSQANPTHQFRRRALLRSPRMGSHKSAQDTRTAGGGKGSPSRRSLLH